MHAMQYYISLRQKAQYNLYLAAMNSHAIYLLRKNYFSKWAGNLKKNMIENLDKKQLPKY